jgi:hypothetical protein
MPIPRVTRILSRDSPKRVDGGAHGLQKAEAGTQTERGQLGAS